MQRFRVTEDSMRPTLVPGDEFVVSDLRPARIGDVVALPHPARTDFWLVKRLTAGPGDTVDGHGRLEPGKGWVSSDNTGAEARDSRDFGPVPLHSTRPRVERFDRDTFEEAVDLLAAEDTAFAGVLARHGRPRFWQRPQGLATLVWLILEQQVSLESGAAMFRRLVDLIGTMSPESLASAGTDRLRSIGVTRQKAEYLLGLANGVLDGEIDLDRLDETPLDGARAALLSIKGIGPWTADAYLLSAVRHPDVFPVGDRALQVGTAEVLGLAEVPGPDSLEMLSLPWRPVRAAAARLIWHAYLEVRGRREPLSPLP